MKGIVLAGGSGTRLYPITKGISKQIMPIYDKPMIYYPLSTLMQAGIREILVITTPDDQAQFQRLLGDGSELGIRIEYAAQEKPRGLADAFIVGAEFMGTEKVCMILGDNLFYGGNMDEILAESNDPEGGIILGYQVSDPERYGVVEFDDHNNVVSIEEKPQQPKSNYAIPGLYFYDNDVIEVAKQVQPSARGEIEITEIHNAYLRQGRLKVKLLDRGTAYLDTGTFESMNDAGEYIRVIEKRTGIKIGCIEEVAYKNGFITADELRTIAEPLVKSGYGKYLLNVLNQVNIQ